MKIPLIKCDCCGGTGKRELSADHWRTLKIISTQFMPISSANLKEKGITSNAINNRLVFLERHRLIKRVGKDGKFILWEAIK